MVAADESAAYATVYTNSGDLSSVHRVDMRSGEDDEVLSDVRYYFSTRPLVSPDLSVVATLDDDFVSELIQLPGGDSTRLERCESVRAFDRSGRVAAVDAYVAVRGAGTGARAAPAGSSTSRRATRSSIWRTPSIYAAAFGPPGDDGLPRSAVVVDRDSVAMTMYDLDTGDVVGTYRPGRR